MKMYVWSDALAFLAVAQANSVSVARGLLLREIGESGDGSCPERDKAREYVLSTNPAIYYGKNAEFALLDSAEVRELEAYIKRNRIDQRNDVLNLKIEQLTAEVEKLRAEKATP
jgi:hypothetical protein